jgi:hypothetical protein
MAGRGRGRGHVGRDGVATHAQSSSSAPSSSSDEWKFEFIIVLNDDPLGIQRLPDKFGEFVTGNESAALQLLEARCSLAVAG